MSTILDMLRPEDLGFEGNRFKSYRPIQLEAIEQVSESEARFQGLALPTGAGKSLVAASIHRLTGWRTVILTSTKGLQEQYLRDFEQIGMRDIRGKLNYQCGQFEKLKCGDGKRAGCGLKATCSYECARLDAKEANLLVSNYAYWLRARRAALEYTDKEVDNGLEPNPIECLILDEVHNAPEELAGYMSCRLYEKELREILGLNPEHGEELDRMKEDLSSWVHAAEDWHREADMQLTNMERLLKAKGRFVTKAELDHAQRLEALIDKLERIQDIDAGSGEWVMEAKSSARWGRSWEFDIVWPGQHGESKLFQGVEHVVLMSATLRPKTMSLLGIRKEEFEFREWPRVFPAQRCPIYYLPARRDGGVPIGLRYKSSDEDLKRWAEWIDLILESRADRKGIIHCIAYHRQTYLMEHSRFKSRLIGNTQDPESDSATEICRKFKESKEPLVLCSPSFSTGWDFPGTDCEFVIIAKVPFPPGKGKAMMARKERDGSYLNYLAMQELVQSSGRGMRSSEDRCEVFCVDGNLQWFINQNKSLAPKWFSLAIKSAVQIPARAPKL